MSSSVSAGSADVEVRAKAIFDAALEAAPPDAAPSAAAPDGRARLIESMCAGNADLLQRVRALLAAHEHADNFLEPPPPPPAALFGFAKDAPPGDPSLADAADSAAASAMLGQRIAGGRYRIIREIAAGGMGVVYLAEQDHPRRTVALKVMRAALASRSMLRRFEHEAEVLGRLQHPGIAQVFEAGTFDLGAGAQPYFAMEYIRGRSLTDYVAAHELAVPARLELLAAVCDAVHYAHQKGVVHRDLKPENILVIDDSQLTIDDSTGERDQPTAQTQTENRKSSIVNRQSSMPKILDFGVARLTDADIAVATMQTDIGQIIGTLPYMSPEQVAADSSAVDTRSDVYALGVIGYELLTGKVPLDVKHKSVAEAARIIEGSDPPSLSAINRAFRGDLATIIGKALEKDKQRRYQSASELGEDIRRFLRNEPISARPATTLYQLQKFARRNKALVAGVLGVFAMLILGVVGTSVGLVQAKAAATEAQRQRASAEEVSRFLQRMLASINPRTALGRDTALLREILDTAAARVRSELADQPLVAATLEGVIGRAYRSLSLYDQAQTHLDRALELRRANLPADSDEIAESLGDVGMLLMARGRYADARPLLAESLDMSTRLHGSAHVGSALCMQNMGVYCMRSGDFAEAERLHREALRVLRSLLPETDSRVVSAMTDLAVLLQARHKYAECEGLFAAVLAQRERTLPPDSPDIAGSLMNLANVQCDQRHYDDAEQLLNRALAIYRKVMPDNHDAIGTTLQNLARVVFATGDTDRAADYQQQALDIYVRAFGPEHPTVARCYEAMANIALARQDVDEAERLCQKALDMRRKLLSPDNPEIAKSLEQMASVRNRQGRRDDAADLIREGLKIHRALGPGDFGAAEALINLGTYERLRGNYKEAESLLREALDMNLRLLGEEHEAVTSVRSRIAQTLMDDARPAEALPLLLSVLEFRRAHGEAKESDLAWTLQRVGETLLKLHRASEAEPYLRESLTNWRGLLPEDHRALAQVSSDLGACLVERRLFDEAEPLLLESAKRLQREVSASRPESQEPVRRVIALYGAWGRPDQAEAWRKKLDAILKASGARRNPATTVPGSTAPASAPDDAPSR